MNFGMCKGCGAPIRWAKTEAGRSMPLDAKPAKRAVARELADGRTVVEIVDTWGPHWATCPEAHRFRVSPQLDIFGESSEGDR